jgi:NADH:ubiquinone oxidoreductase subunit C
VADGQQAIERINDKFAEAVRGTGSFRDQHWIEIDAEHLVEICTWLHQDPVNSYDLLLDVTAIHWPDDPQPMELVYQIAYA